jgi:DNA-binding MarR family transcriptional regulator
VDALEDLKKRVMGMLTERQKSILEFIESYINMHGYSPTVREIRTAVGVKSTSTIQGHLDRLETKGFIEKTDSVPRTIRILRNTSGYKELDSLSIKIETIKDLFKDNTIYSALNGSGKSIERELACPYCNGRAIYRVFATRSVEGDDIGIISYCQSNKCYQIIT